MRGAVAEHSRLSRDYLENPGWSEKCSNEEDEEYAIWLQVREQAGSIKFSLKQSEDSMADEI